MTVLCIVDVSQCLFTKYLYSAIEFYLYRATHWCNLSVRVGSSLRSLPMASCFLMSRHLSLSLRFIGNLMKSVCVVVVARWRFHALIDNITLWTFAYCCLGWCCWLSMVLSIFILALTTIPPICITMKDSSLCDCLCHLIAYCLPISTTILAMSIRDSMLCGLVRAVFSCKLFVTRTESRQWLSAIRSLTKTKLVASARPYHN